MSISARFSSHGLTAVSDQTRSLRSKLQAFSPEPDTILDVGRADIQIYVGEPDIVGLVLVPKGSAAVTFHSKAFVFDRQTILEMAREILRQVDPTTEEKILKCLMSIDAKLPES